MATSGGQRKSVCYCRVMTAAANGTIIYRAHRLRFIVTALFLVPMTAGIAALAYDGVLLGDPAVRSAWLLIALGPLYLWFDYIVFAKIVSPPEFALSKEGITWANPALLEWSRRYSWSEINGPEKVAGSNGVPLLQIIVKATGRKLRLPPSHFGSTYDEMAAAMAAASNGASFLPEQWRSEHPPHPFKHWLQEWGLPLIGGVALALLISHLKG